MNSAPHLAFAVAALACWGCGPASDRLEQGSRVVLVGAGGRVAVGGMDPHEPISPTFASLGKRLADDESVPAGTRGYVSDDAEPGGPDRMVSVVLSDPPFAGMAGKARRDNLKPERRP